jgi:nitroreductase
MSMTTTAQKAATTPDALLASLRWRYAVKKFDPAGKIPDAQWQALEESLVLSPSSYGLQPWKFFVVDNPALRAKLKPVSWEQSQIVDADKLVVFAVKKNFGAADVERFVERISEVRRVPKEVLEGYKKMMLASASLPPEKVSAWLIRQVYIALGVFLTSAAALGVDACPMEGLDKDKYDEILGLPSKGYNTILVATAGVRAADDAYAAQTKVRFAKNELIERL